MPRLRPGYLVVALTLFATIAVGATGSILLARARATGLRSVAERQRLVVSLQARLIDLEITRLIAEIDRLSQLAEVDLADRNLEPEKRVLKIARRDTALFSVAIVLLDEYGRTAWAEPQGTNVGARGAALVGEARGRGRAVLSLSPGEIAVAAPIAGRGAIAGLVSVLKRDLFGDALQRAAREGAGVQLLEVTSAGAPVFAVTSIGTAVPGDLGTAGGQAWQRDRDERRWLVTESLIGEGPLLLRLAQPAALIEDEVSRSYRNLVAILAAALLLVAIGGAFLAVSIRRLETAEVELEHARSLTAMGKAAAAIAHEVKNSLNGLSVSLDLLAQRRADADTAAQVHAQARSEIGRLRGVADDLTLFAAPPRLERSELSLADLCQHAVAGVADVAQDAQVEVSVSAETAEPVRIEGDERKLLGALQNVIRNGIEAMGPGAFGEALGAPPPERERILSVSLRRDAGTAILEIGDRGPGLSPEVRARLFEPFVTTKRGGTGLGLAIAHRVIEAHGGSIHASDRPGGGTLFRIALPLAAEHARRVAPRSEAL